METKEHNIGPNNLYVQEFLPDEETFPHALVLVHGSFGGAFMWRMIGVYLSSKGFRVYALSLRGHKPNDVSNIGTLGMHDYKDDVASVVNGLNLEKPVVIGHSMSGLVVLMYGVEYPVSGVVSIGPSPSKEIQGEVDESTIAEIPDMYTPMDAGMPTDPVEIMQALSDIPQEMLMKMKDLLGPESGKARRDRKRGISIPKEKVTFPYLILAGQHAGSVKFGVRPESSRKMAEHYGAPFIEIEGATHPGILLGKHAGETAVAIEKWLKGL